MGRSHGFAWTSSSIARARQLKDQNRSCAGVAALLSAELSANVTAAMVDNVLRRVGALLPAPPRTAAPKEKRAPIVNPKDTSSDLAVLLAENSELCAELTKLRKSVLTEERVKRELIKLADAPRKQPSWVSTLPSTPDVHGVPVLFMSDQHLGEVVDEAQVDFVNKYNMEIARERWRRVVMKTIDLAFKTLTRPEYPGIVLAFGGDGVSGDIHEELSATNEESIMPVVLELADLMAWTVQELKQAFGRVFVPCTFGNHSRLTKKPRSKSAAFTNFDWLAAQFASREFRDDKNVQFLIPSSEDTRFKIYNKNFVLTHGAQFRGGDGIIGPLGPIARGDNKKRARNAQLNRAYDTLMVGHFHQLRVDSRLVCCGSLVGYNEYAMSGNFAYEPPKQALFFVHPRHGITLNFPVLAEPDAEVQETKWVAMPADASRTLH